MPDYIYRCPEGCEAVVSERMQVLNSVVWCWIHGHKMHRKPQAARVNWNGLRPSKGFLSPVFKELIDGAPRRRAEYKERQNG